MLPEIGDAVAYSVMLTNAGLTAATGVNVLDALPAGLALSNAVETVGSYSNDIWTITDLPPGAAAALDLTAVVAGGTGGSFLTNTAMLGSLDQTDSGTSNNQASAVIQVRDVDIAISKSVDDDQVEEGEFVTFTIVVTNLGIHGAGSILVTDSLPPGLLLDSATPGQGVYSNGEWAVGALAGGAGVTMTVNAQVEIGARGFVITNVASLTSLDRVDGNTANNSDEVAVFVSPVELHVSKTADAATAEPGQSVQYLLAVQTQGPTPRPILCWLNSSRRALR